MSSPPLAMRDITKHFPGVTALAGVPFDVRAGEVHALMGENGAGKSTLMKIASGLYRPDSGTVEIDGRPATLRSPADARRHGIQTVHQELTILDNLDVARNVLLGREPTRFGAVDRRRLRDRAQEVLDELDIGLDARTPADQLSVGGRQMVEIARACAEQARVLILDEPTSSLGRHEEELLFALVHRLRARGVGIVYISHRMAEVFALADRITVLRDGRHVRTAPATDLSRADLIRSMVGRDVAEVTHRGADGAEPPARLRVDGLRREPAVTGVDLTLRAGEVLGVAGLMGSGRTELARLIAGVDRPRAGRMELDGRPYRPRGVRDGIAAGVCYVPEDRKEAGLALGQSVEDNLALPGLRRIARAGTVGPAPVRRLARQWMARLDIRAPGPGTQVGLLSGGNQQKVVLAKWLALEPRVVLLDEPTRGVDVGAKTEIHRLVRELAAGGAAVMVISSELPEVLTVSDRIAVMAAGRVTGVVPAAGATEEHLLDLAFATDSTEGRPR